MVLPPGRHPIRYRSSTRMKCAQRYAFRSGPQCPDARACAPVEAFRSLVTPASNWRTLALLPELECITHAPYTHPAFPQTVLWPSGRLSASYTLSNAVTRVPNLYYNRYISKAYGCLGLLQTFLLPFANPVDSVYPSFGISCVYVHTHIPHRVRSP